MSIGLNTAGPVDRRDAATPAGSRARVVDVQSPAPRDEWTAIADADASSLPEQRPEWTSAICESGGHRDASRLYRFADGRTVVLPLVRRRGIAGAGGQLWSFPPAWGIGGPVGTGLDAAAVAEIVRDLRRLRVARVSLRVDPLTDSWWRTTGLASTPRRAHVIDLRRHPDEMLPTLPRNTRSNLRKAERSDLRIEVDRTGALIDDHVVLYRQAVDEWARAQHEPLWLARWRGERRDPPAKLHTLARHMGDRFCQIVAYRGDQPLASRIILLGPVTRDTRAAYDRQLGGELRAADAVLWRAMHEAHRAGCHTYNMGESGNSSSLARFKERFGAMSVDYAEYRLERLPFTAADQAARRVVKSAIGFEDAR